MDLMKEFQAICRDFPDLRQAFEAVRQQAHDPAQRAFFDDLAASLDKGFVQFQENVPKLKADMDRMEKETADRQAQNLAQVEKIRQQLAEAQVPPAAEAVPVVPALSFPADLGLTLRDRLLKRYGDRTEGVDAPRDAGDVHELSSVDYNVWEGIDRKSAAAPAGDGATKPATPPQPRPAERGPGSIGGMHSMDWDAGP